MGRLALVQPRPVRRELSIPWGTIVTALAAGVAILALLYLAARFTPVFAVRSVEVSGAPPGVRADVRDAALHLEGSSLVGLDGATLLEELEALPSVRSAAYDRAFPNTLRIFVRPELPLGVVGVGRDTWVVSERGRIVRRALERDVHRFPRFELPDRPNVLPGSFLTEPTSRALLATLAVVPEKFPARIESLRLQSNLLTIQLRAEWGRPELRLGQPTDLGAKLAAAAVVLRSLQADYRPSVAYLDVSVPERTVVGANSQVEG